MRVRHRQGGGAGRVTVASGDGPDGLADEVAAWEQLCRATDGRGAPPWPAGEAQALYRAVQAALTGDDGPELAGAARDWAGTAPMTVVVRRIGALRELFARHGGLEEPEDRERLQRVLDQVTTLATEAALAELEATALTDALTDVGNRRAMELAGRASVAAAVRSGTQLSVAVLDLDGLKALNDTHGHSAGDKALAGLAAALRSALRDTDQVFRVGGDEFVALLPLAAAPTVASLMERAAQLDAPAFSWGSATVPDDGTDLFTVLETADRRLYDARRSAGYYGGVPASTATPSAATTRRWPWIVLTAVASAAAAAAAALAWAH